MFPKIIQQSSCQLIFLRKAAWILICLPITANLWIFFLLDKNNKELVFDPAETSFKHIHLKNKFQSDFWHHHSTETGSGELLTAIHANTNETVLQGLILWPLHFSIYLLLSEPERAQK